MNKKEIIKRFHQKQKEQREFYAEDIKHNPNILNETDKWKW